MKIKVYHSALSNHIFAGKPSKDQYTVLWKEDVTIDALVAVAEHIKQFGKDVIITGGGEIITLSVKYDVEVSDEHNQGA